MSTDSTVHLMSGVPSPLMAVANFTTSDPGTLNLQGRDHPHNVRGLMSTDSRDHPH